MEVELTIELIDGWYSWDPDSVDGLEELIERINAAESPEDWSYILGDHIQYGNNKIASNVAIINFNSAHDCPNLESESCQVPDGECYAYVSENTYSAPLDYRRRQEVLWDVLDADTFVDSLKVLFGRKRNPVDFLRFSQSGDFRHRGDVVKAERIASRLIDECDIQAYTYSASDYLDWSVSENLTVNRSNDRSEYGDRRYVAVADHTDAPSGAMNCPYERTDGEVKCGDCTACISKQAPDVYITLH